MPKRGVQSGVDRVWPREITAKKRLFFCVEETIPFMAETLRPGEVIGRDFKVIQRLAAGGMGTVYESLQLSTGKKRALKVMHAQYEGDSRTRQRFVQEARATAAIDSEHIVEMVAAGVDETLNAPWIVMELLQGEDLKSALAARGRFTQSECEEIFAQLGHALAEAHALGLVHRDIKPENIFLATPRRAGVPFTVKLLDFGLAKLVQESSNLTSGTQAVGSPRWMAPEQTKTDTKITPATDVWALGLLAFTLLTGESYWKTAHAAAPSILQQMCELLLDPMETASERAKSYGVEGFIPEGFDEWFARCVDREPERRFTDGGEAVEALLPLLRSEPLALVTPQKISQRPRTDGAALVLEIPQEAHTSGKHPVLNLEIPREAAVERSLPEVTAGRRSNGLSAPLVIAVSLLGTIAVVGGLSFLLRSPRVSPATTTTMIERPTGRATERDATTVRAQALAARDHVGETTETEPETGAGGETSPAVTVDASTGQPRRERPVAVVTGNSPGTARTGVLRHEVTVVAGVAQRPVHSGEARREAPEAGVAATPAVDSVERDRGYQRQVDSQMAIHRPEFLACYDNRVEREVSGTVRMTFDVTAGGRATNVRVTGLSRAPEVARCVDRVLRAMSFGPMPPEGATEFNNSLVFSAPGTERDAPAR